MTNHILPFISEYLSTERYKDKIEQTEPRDWITTNRLSTYGFIISYWISKSERIKAIEAAGKFNDECNGNLHLERLRPFSAAFWEFTNL